MASFEQSKSSKLWSVRFRVVENGKTKNKRLSGFKTKKEALAAYTEYCQSQKIEEKIKEGSTESVKFGYLIDKFMEYQKSNLKSTTYYDAEIRIKNHITSYFGQINIDDITPRVVLEWKLAKENEGYSFGFRQKILGDLKAILKFAETYYDFPPGLRAKITPLRRTEAKREMQYWSADEFRRFISVADKDEYRLLFTFLYICGCRIGEALALKWADVDLNNNIVNIHASMSTKVKGAPYIITSPKTISSTRKISITKRLADDMRAYRANRPNDIFVFGGTRPLSDTSVSRYFKRYIEKSGVKKIRIHDLRHSCASLLISNGCSIVAVSKRLGHSDIRETLNTYSHMMPEDDDKIISALDTVF